MDKAEIEEKIRAGWVVHRSGGARRSTERYYLISANKSEWIEITEDEYLLAFPRKRDNET